MSQLMKCKYCPKLFEPYNTSKKNTSKICKVCRTAQEETEARRPYRKRNYQEEAKRNLEASWKTFMSKSVTKRNKECSLVKEEYYELIQKPCIYCNHYNEKEINGIDRLDNEKGYHLTNCVSCCKYCNRMKHILHPVFFIEKAQLITEFQEGISLSIPNLYEKWNIYVHKIPTHHAYVKRIVEERRNIEYSLTKLEYEQLIYKPCYLCGFKNIIGNGIDRIDNTKGYTIENVKPCCSTCNMMKAFYNTEQFLTQMKLIHEHNKIITYPLEWNNILCKGFQMGAAKSEKIIETKIKQWRGVSIYKAIKSNCMESFKKQTMVSTGWDEDTFITKLQPIIEKVMVSSSHKDVKDVLTKLVAHIHYYRYIRSNQKCPLQELA